MSPNFILNSLFLEIAVRLSNSKCQANNMVVLKPIPTYKSPKIVQVLVLEDCPGSGNNKTAVVVEGLPSPRVWQLFLTVTLKTCG